MAAADCGDATIVRARILVVTIQNGANGACAGLAEVVLGAGAPIGVAQRAFKRRACMYARSGLDITGVLGANLPVVAILGLAANAGATRATV